MKNLSDEQLSKIIRDAFPPVGDAGPSRDLWPQMLQKLDVSRPRFSWFDWALAALALLLCLVVPEAIPGFLYNL